MISRPDFSALFAASPYPYLLIDTGYIIIGANPAYLRATGRAADDIVGKHIFDAFPANPADPDSTNLGEVRASIEFAITSQKPHTSALLRYAIPRETSNGTVFDERYWSAVHTPVFDETGQVAFVSQNAIDVTDLYRFDASAKKYYLKQDANAVPDVSQKNQPQLYEAMTRILNVERNQLQILFNQAPGFIAILTGKSHVFEMANEAYYQLVGHRDIIGKPAMEALPELAEQGFKELLDHAFETGEPLVLRNRKITLQRKTNDPLEERYIDLLYQPIFGQDGRVTGIFGQGNDVTQAYQANRALAEKIQQLEEARARQAFQLQLADMLRTLQDPPEIFTKSARMIGLHFNACRIVYGDYDRDSQLVTYHSNYVDGTVEELNGPHPVSGFGADNFASLEDGATWVSDDLSTDPRTMDAQIWPGFEALGIYSGVIVPLRRNGALISCIFVNYRQPRHWSQDDISLIADAAERAWNAVERVRAEAALKQADRRKDQFLAMLAHELRNPLAPISAAAALLKLKELPPANIARTSDIITRQVSHMSGLVDDLLDVSRVSTGLVVLDRHEVDIKQVVYDAVEQVRPLLEARRHHFTLQMTFEEALVIGDYKRLVQIVANLLNNAAKYTPEGGKIVVKVDAGQERVAICVIDNGIGMSQELLPNVFELFTQGERTPDRSQGGLGLGLALVKSLAELHSGSVSAHSAGLNAGSEFTIRLPRLFARVERAEPGGAPPSSPANPENYRLLVVDDNIDAANMLAMFLQAKGYDVTVEHDPARALQQAEAQKFNGFLLDIGLPGMDGNELARRLRAMPDSASAMMIAITGYGHEFDRESAMAAGFNEYVVKPADPIKIITMLDSASLR